MSFFSNDTTTTIIYPLSYTTLFRSHLVAEHNSGRKDHSQRLWSLVNLELWLRQSIDGDPVAEASAHVAEVSGRRSEEHTTKLQTHHDLVCRLLIERKKKIILK